MQNLPETTEGEIQNAIGTEEEVVFKSYDL